MQLRQQQQQQQHVAAAVLQLREGTGRGWWAELLLFKLSIRIMLTMAGSPSLCHC
jgi:hypothetical protein